VDLEFDEEITLDALRDALEPGMAGGKLDDAVLTESPVPTQAEWFHKAEPLFEGEEPLWDEFNSTLRDDAITVPRCCDYLQDGGRRRWVTHTFQGESH